MKPHATFDWCQSATLHIAQGKPLQMRALDKNTNMSIQHQSTVGYRAELYKSCVVTDLQGVHVLAASTIAFQEMHLCHGVSSL